MADDFSSIENLEGRESRMAINGAWLIRAAYYVALGVLAIWVYKKLFK
jgi:hypothetical protein